MEKYKFEFKKSDNMLEKALEKLELDENQIIYTVNEEVHGILKSKKYILEIVKKEDIANLCEEILNELLESMDVEGKIKSTISEKDITLEIKSQNCGILIGKQGHTLKALELFLKQAISNKIDMYVTVRIDVEGYKEKQIYFLEKKVKQIAREVTLSKVPVKLDYMNSYERRIVHDALSNFKYIETKSEGIEPKRYVVISYKES